MQLFVHFIFSFQLFYVSRLMTLLNSYKLIEVEMQSYSFFPKKDRMLTAIAIKGNIISYTKTILKILLVRFKKELRKITIEGFACNREQ